MSSDKVFTIGSMKTFSVSAHFDGKHILLDEPLELEPNTKLLVTVLSQHDSEHEDWLRLSAKGLASAYSDDEPEYTLDSIIEMNPDYEAK
jgi:hypothetical protein